MSSNTSFLPGIDDDGDHTMIDVSGSNILAEDYSTNGKRLLTQCQGDSPNKRIRLPDSDSDDVFLYGHRESIQDDTNPEVCVRSTNGSSHVSSHGATLVTESLPTTSLGFFRHIFDTHLGNEKTSSEEARMTAILKSLPDIGSIVNEDILQVALLSSLWLEVRQRIKKCASRSELIPSHVYVRRELKNEFLELKCFTISSAKKKEIFKSGQLVQVNAMQAGLNPKSEEMLGLVYFANRRLPDWRIRSELFMVNKKCLESMDDAMIEELELIVPNRSILKQECKIELKLNPLCPFIDIMQEAIGVINIKQSDVFKFLRSPSTSVIPSGVVISSDPNKFNSFQLEAIQRSVDLLHEPASRGDNIDLKGVVICGSHDKVRITILESLSQFIKNPYTSNLQFVVLSECELSLDSMFVWLRTKLRHFKVKDTFRIGGKDCVTEQYEYAKQYVKNEISHTDKKLEEFSRREEESDSLRQKNKLVVDKEVLNRTMKYLVSHGTESVSANIIETADEFMKLALAYQLQSARVILTSFSQFSECPAFLQHLKTKEKLYSVDPPTTTEAETRMPQTSEPKHKSKMLSHCVIVDAASMPDSRAFAFFDEFKFKKMIASSSWLSKTKPCKRPSMPSSFLDRLMAVPAPKVESMIIDVTGGTQDSSSNNQAINEYLQEIDVEIQ
jgi:hypothetical protein